MSLSIFQLIRRRLLLPLQLFLAVFLLGAYFTVPKIEADLTKRTSAILKEMGLEGQVRVARFEGPVASLTGGVTDAEVRTKLVERIESLESLWGLRVKNPLAVQIIPAAMPISYRLDFAQREIKLSGHLPGKTEKNALNSKLKKLFPKSTVLDLTEVFANSNSTGMTSQLLEHLPDLASLSQLRWVAVDDGQLTVSASLPNEEAKEHFLARLTKIGENAHAQDLQLIPSPKLVLKFGPGNALSLDGQLAAEADQSIAQDYVKSLFPKAKLEMASQFDERLGPVEWVLPKLAPLPALQKLGKLVRVEASDELPIVEAAALNVSSQISLNSAIEEAYHKQVKASVAISAPIVTTTSKPSIWAEVGETETPVTAAVSDEAGKALLLERLSILFPKMKFSPTVTLNPALASIRLSLPQLDPLPDLLTIESNFILRGFGLVDGRLKLSGVVPDEATKDRLIGVILKRHAGRVNAVITVDPAYLPSPDAFWAAVFSPDTLTLKGEVSSKTLATTIASDLAEVYPGRTIVNELEILSSGLRPGDWLPWLPGLSVVAAPEQTIQVSWQKNRLTLSARTPSEAGKQAMVQRLRRTYGNKIDAQIEVVNDAALLDQPAVSLIDCIIYLDNAQQDFIASNLAKLERVNELLLIHPDLKITIESHTDNKGAFVANLNTSQLRADNVRKWLIRRQIDPQRLTAHGYGSRRPLTEMKTEAGRDTNRRMEFRVSQNSPN